MQWQQQRSTPTTTPTTAAAEAATRSEKRTVAVSALTSIPLKKSAMAVTSSTPIPITDIIGSDPPPPPPERENSELSSPEEFVDAPSSVLVTSHSFNYQHPDLSAKQQLIKFALRQTAPTTPASTPQGSGVPPPILPSGMTQLTVLVPTDKALDLQCFIGQLCQEALNKQQRAIPSYSSSPSTFAPSL